LRFAYALQHLTTVLFTIFGGTNVSAQVLENNALMSKTLSVETQLTPDSSKKDTSKTIKKLEVGQLPASSDALDSKVDYQASDSMRFDMKSKKIYLYGSADVKYDKIHLTADYIEINWGNNVVHAEGRPDSTGKIKGEPVFDEGSQTFNADKIDYNFKSKKGKISGVFTKQGDGFLHGEQVKKNEKDEFYVKNGKYTTCDLPDHPHFFINASKIKVIPNDKIVSGPANLVIEDVPTPLVVPFGLFPNSTTRKSGILFPQYGDSPALGFFLTDGGYYFGINDYIDASIRGDIYSRGSWGVKSGISYNNRYHYNGNLDLRYSNILQGDPELLGSRVSKDFFVNWKHSQDAKARPNSRFSASVQAGTSNYNALNSQNAATIVANTFQSSISYYKSFVKLPININVSAGHSQNTATKIITLSAPEFQLNTNRLFPAKRKKVIGTERWYEKIGVTYTMQSRNSITIADSLIGRPGWLSKFNNGVQHTLPISTSLQVLKYFTVTPSVNFLMRNYFSSIDKQFDTTSNSILIDTLRQFKTLAEYNFSTSITTRVYSFLKLGKNTIRNVMNPQVSFRLQPDFGTQRQLIDPSTNSVLQLWSPFEQGLYGQPTVGRQGTIGFNVNNNIEGKFKSKRDTTGTGLKKVVILDALNFGTSYNLAADSLNWAPINIAARTKLFKKLDVVYSSNYDFYAINPNNNLRVNKFQFNESGQLLRMLSSSLALTTSLASKKKTNKTTQKGTPEEMAAINRNPLNYYDFDIPWRLNLSYIYGITASGNELKRNQILNFNGDVSITQKWKLGFNSGYDFKQKEFTFTSIDIVRDLHCWEMRFNWIPFGFRKSYSFTIQVKSAMLQDLKMNRRRQWFDLQDQ